MISSKESCGEIFIATKLLNSLFHENVRGAEKSELIMEEVLWVTKMLKHNDSRKVGSRLGLNVCQQVDN